MINIKISDKIDCDINCNSDSEINSDIMVNNKEQNFINIMDVIYTIDISKYNKIEIGYIANSICDFAYDYKFNYDNNFIHTTTSLLELPPIVQKCKYYSHINGQFEVIENVKNNNNNNNEYNLYFHSNKYISIKKNNDSIIKFIDNTKMHILHGIDLNDKFKYVLEGSINIYEVVKYRWKWINNAGIDIYYFDIIVYSDLSDNSKLNMKFISTINIYENKNITPENIKIINTNYTNINKLIEYFKNCNKLN